MPDSRPGFVDAVGVFHPRTDGAVRIVSLVPSLTELLFALGLGERVVGCTDYCVHPAEALVGVPRVGGTKQVRLDRVRACAPTHVIVNVDENRREDAARIASFAHVVATHPIEPADNLELFDGFGRLFGVEGRAAELAARFRAGLARLAAGAVDRRERRVLYLIWRKPWMTVGPTTYVSRLLALIDWRTSPRDRAERYPVVDPGDPALADIELVLLSSEPFPFGPAHADEFRLAIGRPELPVLPVDGELLSWYGSRAIEALDYLASLADREPPSQPTR